MLETTNQLEIVQLDINIIKPYENNSRKHSEEQIEQIVKSIKEFGFTNPILVDENYQIIAGHGRYLAAKKLDLLTIPSIVLLYLTEAQKKALTIADNKIALNASWDDNLLRLEIDNLKLLDFDIDILGFHEFDLHNILNTNLKKPITTEINPDEFNMSNKCPKCGFEYD